jgi:hypothetical protein
VIKHTERPSPIASYHQGLQRCLASLAFASEDDELFFRIANRAPATACGLSRPVTALFGFGCGSMLVRRDEDASELAGLGVASGESSRGLGGWKEALLFAMADIED